MTDYQAAREKAKRENKRLLIMVNSKEDSKTYFYDKIQRYFKETSVGAERVRKEFADYVPVRVFFNKDEISVYRNTEVNSDDFFELADMIFIRNVFIYFDNNLRKKILYSAAKKLSPGGYIFLSVSEICCVGPELIPPSLIKINYGKVYFFVKKDGDNPFIKISNEKR